MPRVVKHPEERKADLIAVAQQLFFQRGYDATTVDHIIGSAGISKGAFYYYFPSKEAVLEALAEQMAQAAAADVMSSVSNSRNGMEQLALFFSQSRQLKLEQADQTLAMFEALFKKENLALYHHVFSRISRVLTPILAEILRSGMADGSFTAADDPETLAEVLLGLSLTTHECVAELIQASSEAQFEAAATKFTRRWHTLGVVADRILGLPPGRVQFVEPGFAEAFFAGWRQKRPA